jgi:chromate transporter
MAQQVNIGASEPQTQRARAAPHEIFLKFLFIGAISFGGGIVAYLRRTLVDETGWITPKQFMGALELGQTVPGTNSANMAVIVGDYLAGPLGALAALVGLCLPGGLLVFGLAVASGAGRHTPIAHAALAGVTACAVGILAAITLRTGKEQFIRFPDVAILIATFVGMAVFKIPLLILAIVLGGIAVYLYRPGKKSNA